ncbi:MAG: AAA family ATPase, partial [Chloroflexi bacterium]|nr:AAA family ATPase [Chloroflexota bacterium]
MPKLDATRGAVATVALRRPVAAPTGHAPAAALRLALLGAPQAFLGDRPLVLRTRKTFALLAYLALEAGPHPREQLADLFWPEADPEDARASLRTTLSYVRQALGGDADAFLSASRESIGLRASAPVALDVQALAEAQRLVRRAQGPGTPRPQVEAAAERYRGSFLAGVSLPDAPDFEAWVEGQRAHWRGVVAELLGHLATLQLLDGDVGAAITTLERWTSVDPDEESAWHRLIELYLRGEDGAGARRAWKAYSESLAELDAEPSPEMVALAARIDGPAGSDPSSQFGSTGGREDRDVGTVPFVGREREWSALFAAFERSQAGRTEVVILEGETGMGKSRLLSQFLHAARRAGADVVLGRAFETVGELPYAPLVEALRARLDEENAPDDLLSDLWLGELSRLVPELRERYSDLPASLDDPTLGRGRIFEAVARLGQALARRKPLVFCLDDLQWTDAATLDLVRYAVRRWTESKTAALVILTGRAENLRGDADLGHWLGGLERDASTLRLELKSLEPHDVARLVGLLAGSLAGDDAGDRPESHSAGTPAGDVAGLCEWLVHRTEGHPHFLVQALHTLLSAGVLRGRDAGATGCGIAIPDTMDPTQDKLLDDLLAS